MKLNKEKAKITIVLLNYKRPQNIPIILKSIKNQTVPAKIFLWNNGEVNINSPLIDRYYKSEENVGCMARWKMAKEATTPYVMSLDDDICFNQEDALAKIIQSLEEQDNENRIIGFVGFRASVFSAYMSKKDFVCRYQNVKQCYVSKPLTQDVAVDVVKGRVMAFRKKLIDNMNFPNEREDDIYLSARLANKARKFHRIPAVLNDAFCELPEYESGNWHQRGHFLSRDRAFKKYFSPNVITSKPLILMMKAKILFKKYKLYGKNKIMCLKNKRKI